MNTKKVWQHKSNVTILGLMLMSALFISAPYSHAQDSAGEVPPEAEEEPNSPDQSWSEPKWGDGERRPREVRERFQERKGQARNERGGRRSGGKREEGLPRLAMKAKFLEFSGQYIDAVKDPYRALGFAALGVKEHYRQQGKPEQAVEELEKMLAKAKDQQARNILLFTMRQVHEAERDAAQFIKINQRIMEENLALGLGR